MTLLTPAAVARHFGVSVSTVQRWLRDGTLRGTKLGPRVWVIDADALAGFVPPARGPLPAGDRRRLLDQAREMVAEHPELVRGDGDFAELARELARQAGPVTLDRARDKLAEAIRQARHTTSNQ